MLKFSSIKQSYFQQQLKQPVSGCVPLRGSVVCSETVVRFHHLISYTLAFSALPLWTVCVCTACTALYWTKLPVYFSRSLWFFHQAADYWIPQSKTWSFCLISLRVVLREGARSICHCSVSTSVKPAFNFAYFLACVWVFQLASGCHTHVTVNRVTV